MCQCLINAFLCPHGQGGGGGFSHCGHFADMGGGGVNFLQFCADVFYEQPLNQIFHYTCCVTSKRDASLLGPFPRHARGQRSRNVAAVASHWQRWFRFDQPEI